MKLYRHYGESTTDAIKNHEVDTRSRCADDCAYVVKEKPCAI
jgi:hypothetical protein